MSGRRSKRAPFIEGEPWDERHRRRLTTALEDEQRMREQLGAAELDLRTFNHGAHWRIAVDGQTFDWWPETGRLITNQKWDNPAKAHDVDQAAQIIRRRVARARARRPS